MYALMIGVDKKPYYIRGDDEFAIKQAVAEIILRVGLSEVKFTEDTGEVAVFCIKHRLKIII